MAYLSLRSIGKIYVSGQNVSVGIRGASLDFERGEFVAITGKSGSGKSTLLNVISGMDTYEEGEMLIEGNATSHYLQGDWEKFREEYISFIFQDYNIIESFTVLENVELALMHIEDKKERRRRAKVLLDRVGLSSHLKHKGSKLSGGQKQRVVIARALAKDSPILLADEPTGNLDSESAKEIVKLLYEISADKLVIIVTHNFDQLEGYATRHVRIFDGAVEKDTVLSERRQTVAEDKREKGVRSGKSKDLANGITLGKSIFKSRPKLSVFLCFLLVLGTAALFVITGFCGDAFNVFKPHYMFTPSDGRVILTKQDGSPLGGDELKALADRYEAESFLHYDMLLDTEVSLFIPDEDWGDYLSAFIVKEEQYDTIIGRYPEKENEVLLRLPLSYQKYFGDALVRNEEYGFETLLTPFIKIDNVVWHVVGVSYEIDNNLSPKALVSEEGYRYALALHYLNDSDAQLEWSGTLENGNGFNNYVGMQASFYMKEDAIYIPGYDSMLKDFGASTVTSMNFTIRIRPYRYDNSGANARVFTASFDKSHHTKTAPNHSQFSESMHDHFYDSYCYVHPSLIVQAVETGLSESYRQGSLFFASEERAKTVAKELSHLSYRAVTARATYEPNAFDVVFEVLESVVSLLLWLCFVVFLAFFISLCTSRTLAAFKGDMAIMRSMGITVKVIRLAMYVRMYISLIPGFLMTALLAFLIYTDPTANAIFLYLYPWQYGLIFLGMILLVWRITRKQIKKLFSESVKKSLKGGDTV